MKKALSAFLLLSITHMAAAAGYVGFGAGYLIDNEEPILLARVGFAVAKTEAITHNLEVETGVLKAEDTLGYFKLETQIIPFMANYRGIVGLSEKVKLYAGLGAGVSYVNAKVNTYYGYDEGTSSFTAQGFIGVNLQVATQVDLTFGARYFRINESSIFEVIDDGIVEAAVNFRF